MNEYIEEGVGYPGGGVLEVLPEVPLQEGEVGAPRRLHTPPPGIIIYLLQLFYYFIFYLVLEKYQHSTT